MNELKMDLQQSLCVLDQQGWQRSALADFRTQKQAFSRFFLGAMVLSEPVLDAIRRELRRVSPDFRINVEQIRDVLVNEVVEPEVMEGEKADEAKKKITRSANKSLRATSVKDSASEDVSVAAPIEPRLEVSIPPPPPVP